MKTGLIVGKFFPFHLGHINMILEVALTLDTLHLVICSEESRDKALFQASLFNQFPSPKDRIQWAYDIFSSLPTIKIHHLNEEGIPPYPFGWEEWAKRVFSLMETSAITADVIYSSEPQDKEFYENLFRLPVTLVDPERGKYKVSATKIRTTPFLYWSYIPHTIRPWFQKTIALWGEEAYKLGKILALLYQAPYLSLKDFTKNRALSSTYLESPFFFVALPSTLTDATLKKEAHLFHALIGSTPPPPLSLPLLDLSPALNLLGLPEESPMQDSLQLELFTQAKAFLTETFRLN